MGEDQQSSAGPDSPDQPEAPPTPGGDKRRGAAGGADIAARLRGLGSKPAPAKKATSKKSAAKKAPAKKGATKPAATKQAATKPAPAKKSAPMKKKGDWVTPAGASTTMPVEQESPRALYSARITFTTTEQQRRALEAAKLDDRIDKTARLRAMVALWEQDERLRKRVDKLARTME